MNEKLREIARGMGLSEDDPQVIQDLKTLTASKEKAAAPEWGLRGLRQTGKINRLSVFALFCAFVVPLLGIVFGILALQEIEDGDAPERGVGLARSAIILGILYLVAVVAFIVLVIHRLDS